MDKGSPCLLNRKPGGNENSKKKGWSNRGLFQLKAGKNRSQTLMSGAAATVSVGIKPGE